MRKLILVVILATTGCSHFDRPTTTLKVVVEPPKKGSKQPEARLEITTQF